MKDTIFRNAVWEDLPQIVEIYNSTVAGRMVTADTEPVTVESRYKWFKEHTPDRRPLWVIEDKSGQMLGWVSFQSFFNARPAYNATVEVSIYLHSDQRGKGLGKYVLQYCIEQAPRYGINTLVGFIFAHNEPSIRLFESAGFACWGLLPHIALLDGMEKSLKILGKRIS